MVKRKSGRLLVFASAFVRADTRTRTGDLRITNALLYQLSHVGVGLLSLVHPQGLEPWTP